MNHQVKVLLVVLVVCLLCVVINLTWIQIFGAEGISGNAFNKRRLVEEYSIERGDIISADGQDLARSIDTGREYRFQREYPTGELFADITGYDSWRYGRTGLEKTFNKELLGEEPQISIKTLGGKLMGASRKGNSLVVTVDSRLQKAASEALGGRKGAIVAMDPVTGAILAMVTSPSFDPNVAVPIHGRDQEGEWTAINQDPNNPLVDRSTSGLYPPGSSFKVVTAAAALDTGVVNTESPFECAGKYQPKEFGNFALRDFSPRGHGDLTFTKALTVSCNVTFAQVGLRLGASTLVRYAELFGFNKVIPFDLPVAKSQIQSADSMDPVALAASSIGQAQDLATPLEMALVSSAVANGGTIMRPFLVKEVRDYNGKIIKQYDSKSWQKVIESETADTLSALMVDVVDEGTGTAAQIDGVSVAGKTGTAEVEGQKPHAWFVCFAPAFNPRVAVSVVVENGGEGGKTAAPIAREVLQAALSF